MQSYESFASGLTEAAKKSLSRLHGHIDKGKSVGFISAHRGSNSPAENNKNASRLKNDLKRHGHSYVPVKGEYVEDHNGKNIRVKEKTFMVVHSDHKKLKNDLVKLGTKHKQDSVLTVSKKHGSNFHGTGSSDWVKKGETKRTGGSGITDVKPRKAKRDFGTQIGGKSFILGKQIKFGKKSR